MKEVWSLYIKGMLMFIWAFLYPLVILGFMAIITMIIGKLFFGIE